MSTNAIIDLVKEFVSSGEKDAESKKDDAEKALIELAASRAEHDRQYGVVDAMQRKALATANGILAEVEARRDDASAPDFISKTRLILERRRNAARRRTRRSAPPVDGAPSDGEQMSVLALDVRMIPVDKIFVDPDFDYARVHEDPLHPEWYGNEGQHIEDLAEAMKEEGLKETLEVQIKGGEFMLRAGMRRWKAAKLLGWKLVPATIIPQGIPLEWQYWSMVLRNTAHKNMGTYEVALAAQTARDKYDTPPTEFARKCGFTSGYVFNLLRCIDKLPPYLIEQWRNGARVTLDQWITLSHLEHEDAIKLYKRWMGYTPQDRMRDAAKNARRKPLPPPKWLDRMQRLYVGVEGSDLPPRVRDHVLHAIEHCMGMRDGIPNVYEPSKHKLHEKKARMRATLRMPDPAVDGQMPPPADEVEDKRTISHTYLEENDERRERIAGRHLRATDRPENQGAARQKDEDEQRPQRAEVPEGGALGQELRGRLKRRRAGLRGDARLASREDVQNRLPEDRDEVELRREEHQD